MGGEHGEDSDSAQDCESKDEMGIAADDDARMSWVTKIILLVAVTCDQHFGDDCK